MAAAPGLWSKRAALCLPCSPTRRWGDEECDIDLSRYGCAPGAHLAEIALKHGRFHLRGLAQVARKDGSVNCLDEEVALHQGDMITLTMADGHPLQLRFEWE